MPIILKYIIRSSLEKKMRTFLIILAIAVSGALFYASLSMKENLEVTYTKSFLQLIGNADIRITTNEDSISPYVSDKLAKKLSSKASYIVGRIDSRLDFKVSNDKHEPINVVGMNLKDYKLMNTLVLCDAKNLEPFEGNKIIISQYTAKYYHLKIGDTMELMMNNKLRKYKIVGMAAAQGMFLDESRGKYCLVPFDKLSDYLDTSGHATSIFIKARDQKDVPEMINELQTLYRKYEVKQPFTQADLDEKTGMMSMSLLFMTIMVSFMSIFIIYSSFKVIMLQKLPCLGTFRSIGADKKKIDQVMFLESGLYGLIGGVFACILGIVISYLLSIVTMPDELKAIGTKVALKISLIKLVVAFFLANGICLVSTVIPILSISRKSIKEIVLGIPTVKKNKKGYRALIGFGMVIVGGILPFVMQESVPMAMIGMLVSMPAIALGTIYIVPFCTKVITYLISPVIRVLFGNVGQLALTNVRTDSSLINSATLMMIGVSVLLMVNTLTDNLTKELILSITDMQGLDIQVRFEKMDNSHVARFRTYKEVADVSAGNEIYDVPVKELTNNVESIGGVSNITFLKFLKVNIVGDREEIINKLQQGRNVVITKTLMKRNHLQIGDQIEIDFGKFNGKKRNYTIVGVADTVMEAGNYLMIGQKYLRMDTKNYYYTDIKMILHEGASIDLLKEKIQKDFKIKNPSVETGPESRKVMRDSISEITSLVAGFAMVAVAIGVAGIINNFVISFIERKRSLAVLRSIGMDKWQVFKMLMIEGSLVGLIGSTVGLLGGCLDFNISPLFMTVGNVDMHMKYYPALFIFYILGGMGVAIMASSSPAKNSSKLNIIEEIKYE